MSGSDDPFTYNTIEVPTVVGLLRNILTQYPDNGQIIKELVQNAEDAGATKVEIVHVPITVKHPEADEVAQRFIQAPAVCLYNNSVFSEADWYGIRKLSDSIKKNNPLQVGQFGLGFKSVFHITDCLAIISGKQVLFMDPSEPEDKMCRSIPLKNITRVVPEESWLRNFGNYLTAQELHSGDFGGTLFWFPLRQSPSKISDTAYTSEHVRRLFVSFAVEADVCLTFLKSIKEIRICTKNESNVSVTHKMEITSSDVEAMRERRRCFRKNLEDCKGAPGTRLVCSYDATIRTTTGTGQPNQCDMRILHFIPGRNDAEWMKWGGKEQSKHVPLVGVAVPMCKDYQGKGHVFSFLPLPPDPTNQTSLPIQVNGAFILNQNRRQVKWKTSESNKEPDVAWNEELVVKVVSRAYIELLSELLSETRSGKISADTWYSFLPSINSTVGRWQELARKVWCHLLDHPIISTKVKGYMKTQDVLLSNDLCTLKTDVDRTVRSVLCSQSLPVADVPRHIEDSLRILNRPLSPVQPQHLRQALRSCHLDKQWNLQHLLCYAATDKKYHELCGLPLLPLQDDSWTKFNSSGCSGVTVYLCGNNVVKALLGLGSIVASVKVSPAAVKILKEIADSGSTQLRTFNIRSHGPSLIQQSVTYVQTHKPNQNEVGKWLSHVWGILQGLDITSITSLYLLPTSQPPDASFLTSLTSPVVVQRSTKLSSSESGALGLLGVVVVPELPSYIKHIGLQAYLHSPDRHGVTQALNKVTRQRQIAQLASHFNSQRSEEQRKALHSLIDTHTLEPNLKTLLRKLNLFKAEDKFKNTNAACLENVSTIAPEGVNLPVNYPETLLVLSDPQEKALAVSLGATTLSKEDLCIRALRSSSGGQNTLTLTQYILKDCQLVGSSKMLNELRNTRFVPDVNGSLLRPSELYDPEDPFSDALIGETSNPNESFRQHYPILRSLGLRKVQDMPTSDFINVIKRHPGLTLSDTDRTRKSTCLLRALDARNDCVTVCQAVRGVPFVCGVSSRPNKYPCSLPWVTSTASLQPQSLRSSKYGDVLGSCASVVECGDVPNVAGGFGWVTTPGLHEVIQHLRNIIAAYDPEEWSKYFHVIKRTYSQLCGLLDVDSAQLASMKSERCVLTEQGFKTPQEVYVWPGEWDLQLQPYLHLLPMKLRESERLFLHLGCAPRQDPTLLLTVLQRIQQQQHDRDVKRDLRLVVSVLDKLQHHLPELPSPVLIPVRTQEDVLEMVEVDQTAYTEAVNEWIDSEELEVKIVHQCVSLTLAQALGVRPLQNFLSAGGEAVMEWGQREPLTTRLHNLLRQYRDGLSVLKELVQNADDAGATTLEILYDERQNMDSRELVLGAGMAECQGPALWAYNDALFTEEDFANLREVGAGTKELQPTKIGKFGLGFCSVYNLTDIPSFVSGSSYVVFDPHLTHLNACKNSPGMRFNFTNKRNSYMLRSLQGQFKPFLGVFGCDIQSQGNFQGTLFRLALRTPSQASTSLISNTCYSHTDVVQLLKMFSGVVGQLLLFTQHVKSISVFHLPSSATNPSQMVKLFSASRQCQPVPIPGLSTPALSYSILESAAALLTQSQNKFEWNGSILQERSRVDIRVQCTGKGGKLCGIKPGNCSTTWLISWHSGTGASCHLAAKNGGKAPPLSGVGVPVNQGCDGWQPQCLSDLPQGFYQEGHFHCFLPLPVKTFLPVQINGILEVASDRTNLLMQTKDDRQSLSWNATLLGDATVWAHLGLMEAIRDLGLSSEGVYHSAWPVVGCGGGELIDVLTHNFYRVLEQQDIELFQCDAGEWHPLSRCFFLDNNFLEITEVGEVAFEFLEVYLKNNSQKRMVRLPRHIQVGFDRNIISKHTITKEKFYKEYFIPHLMEEIIGDEKRNQLTLYLLDSQEDYVNLLRDLPCIPTNPHGTPKTPSHLIKPKTTIAKMFTVEDERFPCKAFLTPTRAAVLVKLGMNERTLPTELVVERAETIAGLALVCPDCARDRVWNLLQYISAQIPSEQDHLAQHLRSVPFLPVMPKPVNWEVSWHGECDVSKAEDIKCSVHRMSKGCGLSLIFDCPSTLCLPNFKALIGSSYLLLEDSIKNLQVLHGVLEKLGVIVNPMELPVHLVIEQLCVFSSSVTPGREMTQMCHDIYEHLEDVLIHIRKTGNTTPNDIKEIERLRTKQILITKNGFKEPELFAINSDSNCCPDLFCVCTEGLWKHENFIKILGIKESYDFDVVMKVINKKIESYADHRLNDEEIMQLSRLLHVLFKVRTIEVLLPEGLQLPDTEGYLHPRQDLCFDDRAELSSGDFLCLHGSISVSADMIKWLGIKSKTRKRLSDSSNRLCFGQKEPLTTRLRNILQDYPCDSGIMKELLQNADDAGATEVTFYKDFRHLPDEKLFDSKWSPLQGPALTVFNNKGFTQQDLKSIQDLGNSSKKEDPATTGQYGIGFNAVYHLTDAPSFLTRGPHILQGETLCMFDPHCWYDPSATHDFPGVQFINLNDLRKDHPHSFVGYLEQELPQEGTVFRLPLRKTRDSLISKETLTEEEVCELLEEFKGQMSHCLLFLRNVRKISVKKVEVDGRCTEEYCVEAKVRDDCRLPSVLRKKSEDTKKALDPCSVEMVRTCYTMNIQDNKGTSSEWLIVQQLGVKENTSLPDIVREAFDLKTLNLLPHGGVALLVNMKPYQGICTRDIFSTSCYLPLPVESGLPFSINGHFTLNASRQNLWSGRGDAKGQWNSWLLKELLVPAAVHAVEVFRTSLFPSEEEHEITEEVYRNRTRKFHSVLPLARLAKEEKWKDFVKWFYEEVRNKEFHFFDSFIPETDVIPKKAEYVKTASNFTRPQRRNSVGENRTGRLVWYAYHSAGHEYPVHFISYHESSETDQQQTQQLGDIFKRLGMKLGSHEMFKRLQEADSDFKCPILSPDSCLHFIKSWEKDASDCCKPRVDSKVTDTPFLNSENVMKVLKYVKKSRSFVSTSADKLPLLITNDDVLRCFSNQTPRFVSSFCELLPTYGSEFVASKHVDEIEKSGDKFKDVVKKFTPTELAERLPHVLDVSSYCAENARQPISDNSWLNKLWRFIVSFTEKEYKQGPKIDWALGKEYILKTLGHWAFYPVQMGREVFLIPIKNAWQVLDVFGHDISSVFHRLPLPHPSSRGIRDTFYPFYTDDKQYIPKELHLATSLEDPPAVLKLLNFHSYSVNSFFQDMNANGWSKMESQEILEYLGRHCAMYKFPTGQIRALNIFKESCGKFCTLVGRNLIVLEDSTLKLDKLQSVCMERNLLIISKPDSEHLNRLYKYIEPNCILNELDLYTRIILPNINILNEEQRIFYLDHLRRNLPIGEENTWNEAQRRVVVALKSCSFIDSDGILRTAENFYDPTNPVFCVMGYDNLPQCWQGGQWSELLKQAGMIHVVTPDMFVQFASLVSGSENVKKKSKVLCDYLKQHIKDLKEKMPEILRVRFLVPEKYENLETILAHHRTECGLTSFSEGTDHKYANIIWSRKCLLPSYAMRVAKELVSHCNEVNVGTPNPEDVTLHIIKLCNEMHKSKEKSEVLKEVMEDIYKHLLENVEEFLPLIPSEVPIIHIPDHKVFVPVELVAESVETEIIPYLYKAPLCYGKYFPVFEKLGISQTATPDLYANVLKMIHNETNGKVLHPEETRIMKTAMQGLVKLPYKLGKLSSPELYLPSQDETLRRSCDMLVADDIYLLSAVKDKLDLPTFCGFKHLGMDTDDGFFVSVLPDRLKPKFLSELCKEDLILEGMVEEESDLVNEIQELLQSEDFRIGVFRVLNHYSFMGGRNFTEEDRNKVRDLLSRVIVRQVRSIKTNITLKNNPVGQRSKMSFIQTNGEGDLRRWVLYLNRKIPPKYIPDCLSDTYSQVLSEWKVEGMKEISVLLSHYDKPHDINKYLDTKGIRAYNMHTSSRSLFRYEIGTYLDERFIGFLDNSFCEFNPKEIVCMMKYLCEDGEDEDDDIFIIVEVVRLVEENEASAVMNRKYEVNTSRHEPCLVVVKAHQLYKFVRKEDEEENSIVSQQAQRSNREQKKPKTKEEIFKEIRDQLREIWQVNEERERRHLLRRLLFKWHPDKNPDKVELCTEVMQYIQSLVARLERGEDITREENPPQWQNNNFNFNAGFNFDDDFFNHRRWDRRHRGHGEQRRPRSDLREARRWHGQARSDLEAAQVMMNHSPSWTVFMCYQAAEKLLLATLFAKDMEEASQRNRNGPLHRSLTGLAQNLTNPRAVTLAQSIQECSGGFLSPLYPTLGGCPKDRFGPGDARRCVDCCQELLEILGQQFQ